MKFKVLYTTYFLWALVAFHPSIGNAATEYCGGHGRKIIISQNDDDSDLFPKIQRELNRFSQYGYNERYEICFELRTISGSDFVPIGDNQKLTLTNNTDREVVIGFLKARRTDDSTTPILEIRGHNVTVFAPEMSNVKQAIKLFGVGHKIIDGIINGVANAPDSKCISGNTSKSEIKNLTINNCTNAISLNGNGNNLENVAIMPHLEDYAKVPGESEENYKSRILAGRPVWPSGICIAMTGQSGLIKNVSLDKCYGTGIQILGSGFRIENSQIQGESEFEGDKTRYSTDCLLIKKSSNIVAEANEISNCHEGIHIQDSQQVYLGPELLADFEQKKNEIHHNNYAIHAQNSQQVFAWHNKIYKNGTKGADKTEEHKFGIWLESTNYLESVLLSVPIFESFDGQRLNDFAETAVVKYDSRGENSRIDFFVPGSKGEISIAFPPQEFGLKYDKFQSESPFTDCLFENADIGLDGFAKVSCPIPMMDDLVNKKINAVVQIDEAGTSPFAEAVGSLNDFSGPLVSAPSSDAGNMSAEAGSGSSAGSTSGSSASGEVAAVLTGGGGGGGGVSGGGGSGGSGGAKMGGCSLNNAVHVVADNDSKKIPTEFFVSFIIMIAVLCAWRNRYGVG